MFSLKFDLLFPSIEMAKAAARKLNSGMKRKDVPIEPREIYRMQQELRAAAAPASPAPTTMTSVSMARC